MFFLLVTSIAACDRAPDPQAVKPTVQSPAVIKRPDIAASKPGFIRLGSVTDTRLDEISGLQAGEGTDWWVHTDDGRPQVHLIDQQGRLDASIELGDAKNRDWEDMTRVPYRDGSLLVIADSGDNEGRRKNIQLYFYPSPVRDDAGVLPASLELLHRIDLRYPGGPRDCESVAFDPVARRILLVTKRDVPPRIYGVDLEQALSKPDAEIEYLGEMAKLRPPTPLDFVRAPKRGAWISQPTGMDISPDGRIAAIITYRSLYLFQRRPEETWPQALARKPLEIEGPPGFHDEAVSFSRDQEGVVVTGENLPAAIYRLEIGSLFPGQPGSMP